MIETIIGVIVLLLTAKELKRQGVSLKKDIGKVGASAYLEMRELICDEEDTKAKK